MNRDNDIKKKQERLREAHWNPLARWKVIQDTITWAESQQTVLRNTRQACLQKQNRLLQSFGKKRS